MFIKLGFRSQFVGNFSIVFFTTKGKGFGLGLFLSKASVTRAGGSVKLYSHEEGGTLTELRLPRVARGDIDE